ncbi:MAG TPA: hypothetical protein VK425_01240 [Acidimicrobiales bacterium]|nr:hypothetical protein [Acidimicrobiales bacterium]
MIVFTLFEARAWPNLPLATVPAEPRANCLRLTDGTHHVLEACNPVPPLSSDLHVEMSCTVSWHRPVKGVQRSAVGPPFNYGGARLAIVISTSGLTLPWALSDSKPPDIGP